MATEAAGEQRTGNAVPMPAPAPVVTGVMSCFWGISGGNVAWSVLFHGLVSAVVLAILVVVLDKDDAYHRMCLVAKVLGYSSGVEILAAVLMLALILAGWWSPVLSFVAIFYAALVTIRLSVRLLYDGLFGRDCCFIGDSLKAAVPVSIIVVGPLALSFWFAKLVMRSDPYGADGHSQSQTSVHCTSSQV